MNFYQILILVIVGAVAIRFTFKFDLNRFLEKRRKIRIDQLKNICTHCKIEFAGNNQIKVESYFYTDFGNPNYICSRCGRVVPFEEDVKRMAENYAKDPKRFLKNEKRFVKNMKKLKLA